MISPHHLTWKANAISAGTWRRVARADEFVGSVGEKVAYCFVDILQGSFEGEDDLAVCNFGRDETVIQVREQGGNTLQGPDRGDQIMS